MQAINKNKFIVFFCTVLMLQSLRHTIFILYILLVGVCIFISLLQLNFRCIRIYSRFLPFVFGIMALPFFSIPQLSIDEFIISMTRYFPVAFFLLIALANDDLIYDNGVEILHAFVWITLISALLIIYQSVFGKISFLNFNEATERVGFARYGSLLGSPTSYGTMSLISIFIIHDFDLNVSRIFNRVVEFAIIVGGVFCLSKSFFINIIVCYTLIIVVRDKEKKIKLDPKKFIFAFLGIVSVGLVFKLLIDHTVLGAYFEKMYEYTFHNQYMGANEDLLNRLTTLPIQAYSYYDYSPLIFLVGVGFKGYSGIMGLPAYPMCHNNYADVILAQGIPFFIVLLFTYTIIFIDAVRRKSLYNKFTMQLILYILINMLAGQYSYLHIYAMIFFSIIVANYQCREGI